MPDDWLINDVSGNESLITALDTVKTSCVNLINANGISAKMEMSQSI